VPGQDTGTVTIWERVPGQVYAQGQGIFMGEAGGTIWNGMAIQRMSGEGMGGSIRSVSAYQAPAEGPLSRLNGVLVLSETEMAADGTTKTTMWEWEVSRRPQGGFAARRLEARSERGSAR
jgi:hypothetical protein